ncbi:MAG: hypothetical protein KDC10_16650 [Calditrichaeota bacterium]|nr:hypothetical protein [Calditrichota bacterium]
MLLVYTALNQNGIAGGTGVQGSLDGGLLTGHTDDRGMSGSGKQQAQDDPKHGRPLAGNGIGQRK